MIFKASSSPPWWAGFSICLFLPLSTLFFLLSGPHAPGLAIVWTLPVWLLVAADHWGPSERRGIPADAPPWFFDGLLYALAILQAFNIPAMGWFVSRLDWDTGAAVLASLLNLLALRILGGTNACCSVIAPAHELIHRRSRIARSVGRLLLGSVFYDHFHIAHKVGHHARLGTAGDPSTAQANECYERFFRRSFISQWRIACQQRPRRAWAGLLLETACLYGFYLSFGALAAFMLLYQSLAAIRLLEAVNYFQHFGLMAGTGAARAWRCDSAISLFLFLGLSRHADHHQRPGVPYQGLRDLPGGPDLPLGYLGTAIWVKNASGSFRRWALARAV